MSTSVRLGRPKGQTLTPQMVVQSAITCLETEGIAAVGVNRVAKQLGVQPPAIYKHLDGNAGLHRAVRLEGWRQFVAAYCVENQPCTTPEVRLRQAADQFRQFAHQHPELYTFIMSQPLDVSDPEFKGIYQDLEAFYQQALVPMCSSPETMIVKFGKGDRTYSGNYGRYLKVLILSKFVQSSVLKVIDKFLLLLRVQDILKKRLRFM